MLKLNINDIFDELKLENKRLLNELTISRENVELLEKYRKLCSSFVQNECVCGLNTDNEKQYHYLEIDYKTFLVTNIRNKERVPEIQNLSQNTFQSECNNEIINNEINNNYENRINGQFSQDISINTNNSLQAIEDNGHELNAQHFSFVSDIIKQESIVDSNDISDTVEPKTIGRKQGNNVKKTKPKPNKRPKAKNRFTQKSKKFNCQWPGCDVILNTYTTYWRHMNRHKSGTDHICPVVDCRKSFKTSFNLRRHQYTHNESYRKVRTFGCTFSGCDERFSTKVNLKKHETVHCPVVETTEVANYSYYTKDDILNVMKTEDLLQEIDFENNIRALIRNDIKSGKSKTIGYSCNYTDCDYISGLRDQILIHVSSIHTFIKPFGCTECDQRFALEKLLYQHMSKHNNILAYVCDWPGCGAKFNIRSKLAKHKDTHCSDKQYLCDWPDCDRRFVTKPGLEFHMITHSGKKLFQCRYVGCDKRFSFRNNMYQHMKRHKI